MSNSFSISGITFHWYGLIVGVAVILFYELFSRLVKKHFPQVSEWKFGAVLLIGAFIGARSYHLLTDWQLYQNLTWFEVIAVWNGGIGMIGAFIGGAVSAVVYVAATVRKKKLTMFTGLADCAALALPFAQAIGRWGNYVNQELFGLPTTLPWGIEIDGWLGKFHPLFLYESIWNFVLGVFLWRFYLSQGAQWKIGSGRFMLCYIWGYATIRFVLEFLRIDSSRIGLPGLSLLTTAQWMMIGVAAVATGLFWFTQKKYEK